VERYDRQRRVGPGGRDADDRLARLRVLLVGAGGIGAPLAVGLVRAGVGALRLVDPDVVGETDLPRQVLYFPEDAATGRAKIEAALRELRRIGGRSRLDGRAIALTPRNARDLVDGIDLVVDATDHLPAREWIEDACRELAVPWVHTAALGDEYRVIPFLTPVPPCFRCYLPESPPVAALGTCESEGVLPVATALAAQHALAAIWGWLRGEPEPAPGTRRVLRGRVGATGPREIILRADPRCPTCARGAGSGPPRPALRLLCGKRRAEAWVRLGRDDVERRLIASSRAREGARGLAGAAHGWRVFDDAAGMRAERGDEVLTLAPDGRLIYGPAEDLPSARERLLELLGPDALS